MKIYYQRWVKKILRIGDEKKQFKTRKTYNNQVPFPGDKIMNNITNIIILTIEVVILTTILFPVILSMKNGLFQ